MKGRVKRFRLFVRDPETGIEHRSSFIYRNHRDREARAWREAGAHVVSWDVVPLPTTDPQVLCP